MSYASVSQLEKKYLHDRLAYKIYLKKYLGRIQVRILRNIKSTLSTRKHYPEKRTQNKGCFFSGKSSFTIQYKISSRNIQIAHLKKSLSASFA